MQTAYSNVKKVAALGASTFALALVIVAADASGAPLYGAAIDWEPGDGISRFGSDEASGSDGDGTKTTGRRGDPDNALGAPDSTGTTVNFLSLGLGGTAVFSFGQAFESEATIFEVTFTCTGDGPACANYPEQAEVFVGSAYTPNSFDLSDFTSQGRVGNAQAQNGAVLTLGGPFQYLALVDRSDRDGGSDDGFDVDAVRVSSIEEPDADIPVPGTLGLLGFGMMALGTLVRRKRA